MLTCPKCNTMNPDGEQICLACNTSLAPSTAAAGAAASTRCPNGHPIDPSWTSCPYCERIGPGGAKKTVVEHEPPIGGAKTTRLEGTGPPPAASGPAAGRATRLEPGPGSAPGAGVPDRRTRLEGEGGHPPPAGVPGGPPPLPSRPTRLEEPARGRHTVLQESAPGAPPPPVPVAPQPAGASPDPRPAPAGADAGSARRLVAVLAAPDLVPGGAVFPVRGGKNVIGANPACEVNLRNDSEVSGEHALILHRGGLFYLADRMSTNGTWVNGEEVDPTSNAVVLADRDQIRCGRTELVFLTLKPTADAGPAKPVAEDASPELTQQGG